VPLHEPWRVGDKEVAAQVPCVTCACLGNTPGGFIWRSTGGSQQCFVRAAASCSRVGQVNTAPARCLSARRGAGDSEGSCEITLWRVCGARRVSGGCWCGGGSAVVPHSQWPDSCACESLRVLASPEAGRSDGEGKNGRREWPGGSSDVYVGQQQWTFQFQGAHRLRLTR
jgi:hypothetical protein